MPLWSLWVTALRPTWCSADPTARIVGALRPCHSGDRSSNPTTERKVPASRATGRLAELCARYGIARPRFFGPSHTGPAKPDSDMDVLCKLEPDRRLGWGIEHLAREFAVQP